MNSTWTMTEIGAAAEDVKKSVGSINFENSHCRYRTGINR